MCPYIEPFKNYVRLKGGGVWLSVTRCDKGVGEVLRKYCHTVEFSTHARCCHTYGTSVQSLLCCRVYRKCGLYHASLSSLTASERLCCRGEQTARETCQNSCQETERKREREREREMMMMAVIAYNNNEDAEWLDDDLPCSGGRVEWV